MADTVARREVWGDWGDHRGEQRVDGGELLTSLRKKERWALGMRPSFPKVCRLQRYLIEPYWTVIRCADIVPE